MLRSLVGSEMCIRDRKYNNLTNDGGVHASQREIGTDSHRKYVEKMVPGSDWGKQFINKYRKK